MNQKPKYLIDTNVFLRVFVRENEQAYQSSKKMLEACRTGLIKAIAHDLVLAELICILQGVYKQPKQTAVELVASIVNLRGLEVISGFDERMALNLYKTSSVKYIDACLASIDEISKKEWVIVSYDSDFKKLPVIWQRPEEMKF